MSFASSTSHSVAMSQIASSQNSQGQVKLRTEFDAFPYEPYSIQRDFMQAVYAAIQNGGVGIVESPTGTGKTLSLICSALQWLVDQHKLQEQGLAIEATNQIAKTSEREDEEPDWMRDFEVHKEQQEQQKREQRRGLRLQAAQQQRSQELPAWSPGSVKKTTTALMFGHHPNKDAAVSRKQQKKGGLPTAGACEAEGDEEFLVDDWESDDEENGYGKRKKKQSSQNDSSDEQSSSEDEDDSDEEPLKVFFCSRTHSQLAQFIGELKKTEFAASLRVAILGSRKNLCINEAVLRLKSSSRINERCLDLQNGKASSNKKVQGEGSKKKASKASGCPYMSKRSLERRFRNEVMASPPMDIEDLVRTGKRLGTCPYYGSRRVTAQADVVVLPYQSLFHKSTRESLKVGLAGCVVIVDEAHNLVDTVTDMYSCRVTALQVATVDSQLNEYLARFRLRLAPANRRYIQQLLVITKALAEQLVNPNQEGRPMSISEFEFQANIDSQNLVRLGIYLQQSNIVHKVSGYGEKQLLQQLAATGVGAKKDLSEVPGASAAVTAFRALADFIAALTSADADGRVLIASSISEGEEVGNTGGPGGEGKAKGVLGRTGDLSRSKETGEGNRGLGVPPNRHLKFIMLNAAKHFAEVVSDARAVVLAGGTLQPIADLQDRLFPQLPDEKVHIFSCGHIVPKESVLPIALAKGPTGKTFDFTFQSRGSPQMIEELGRLLSNLCAVVPEGIVCFFPSFSYEAQVVAAWEASGLLRGIERKKKVFREPRSASGVETTLREYRECIEGASSAMAGEAGPREGFRSQTGNCGVAGEGGLRTGAGEGAAMEGSSDAKSIYHGRECPGRESSPAVRREGGGSQRSQPGMGDCCRGGGPREPGPGVVPRMAGTNGASTSGREAEADVSEGKTGKGGRQAKGLGALLLCVVGGKMSEGINFSDGMGRCVVMVGLPYPSPSDPELVERMRYLDNGLSAASSSISMEGGRERGVHELMKAGGQGNGSNCRPKGEGQLASLRQCGRRGREYYENLCMKAVNQSIGRAIRHINDYAAILLVDARYATLSASRPFATKGSCPTGPSRKLPGWIQESLVVPQGGFGEVHRTLHQFFKRNQSKSAA